MPEPKPIQDPELRQLQKLRQTPHPPPAPTPQLPPPPAAPPIEKPLTAAWQALLDQASFFHDLVDVLRRRVTPQHEVEIPAMLIALRYRMGAGLYDELMSACGSHDRFFSSAARFIKLYKGFGDTILLGDVVNPFWLEEHNMAYHLARPGAPGPSWLGKQQASSIFQ